MGLILECYAVDANQLATLDPSANDIDLVRAMGVAVGSVSINAQAPETALSWIAGSLLQTLDLAADHASGALVGYMQNVTEKHLGLFGWNIANCASNAAQQIDNGSERDISNHLLTPTRDIFIYDQHSDWLALLVLVLQGPVGRLISEFAKKNIYFTLRG